MIGIYGGTFDPVHLGHLRPAVDVYSLLNLSQIHFIPCGQPPHRNPPIASAQQRLEMLRLALGRQTDFVVDQREIDRAGPSYMVDTIKSLIADFPKEKFCLIIGMDAFVYFDKWKDWETITSLANLVITQRPRFDTDSIPSSALIQYMNEKRTNDTSEFLRSEDTHCFICPVTQLDISSTNIRAQVSEGKCIDYLLPEKVVNYIHDQDLYK
jgi:nicotinate-nucleotide adenylyltransferase